ncbi:MAG: hypothetical protein NZ516_06505 [Raineya sp.]|nr:hypothetical protein [Raineya sp.]
MRAKSCWVAFLLVILLACRENSTQNQVVTKDSTGKSNPKQYAEEDSVEYVFEDKKPMLNEKQVKGIVINVVQQYCQSLNEADFKKLQSLFADSVQSYLGNQKISKEVVAQMARARLKNLKNPRFFADLAKIQVFPQKILVPIKQLTNEKNITFEAEFSFDEAFNIIAYQERPYNERKKSLQELWEGRFVIEGSKQVEAYLLIKNFKENQFEFVLEINPEGNCKSKYEGKAVLNAENEAFSIENNDCKVAFLLKNEGELIAISEKNRCLLHSITCSFEGNYTRFKEKEFRWNLSEDEK